VTDPGRPDRVHALVDSSDERAQYRAFESLAAMDDRRLAATLESRSIETLHNIVEAAVSVDSAAAPSVCRAVVEHGGASVDLTTIAEDVLSLSHPDAVDVALDAYRCGDAEERVEIAGLLTGQLTPDLAWALADVAEADCTDEAEKTATDSQRNHVTQLREQFSHYSGITRRAAALGLGVVGTEQSVEPLTRALEHGTREQQRDAIAGLSLSPLELAAEPLARCCHDEDLVAEASETLRVALDRLEWNEYLADPIGQAIVDALVAVTDAHVRSTLIHAVHSGVQADVYRDDDDVFELLAMAPGLPEPDARAEAATLLALTGREAAIDAILPLFDDPHPSVRSAAAGSVTKVGADLGRRFSALLQGTDTYRTSAAYGALDASAAVGPLLGLLDDDDPGVRHTAAAALGETGDDRATEQLVARLENDSDPTVRRAAADALGRISPPTAITPLRTAIGDDAESVRRTAVIALGNPAFGLTDELVDLLASHDEPSLRSAAAKALAKHDPSNVLGPLCQALRTESEPKVRATVADALRTLDEPAAVPVLEDALADAKNVDRDAIELAIDELAEESG
jgi:HEAT repeat protein/S-adenosylmethionine/arginine decarboxylase-like enzyme